MPTPTEILLVLTPTVCGPLPVLNVVVTEIGVAIFDTAEDAIGQHCVDTGAGRPADHGIGVGARSVADLVAFGCTTARHVDERRTGSVAETGAQRSVDAGAGLGAGHVRAFAAAVADVAFDAVDRGAALAVVAHEHAAQPAARIDVADGGRPARAGEVVAQRNTGIGAGPGIDRRNVHGCRFRCRRLAVNDVGGLGHGRSGEKCEAGSGSRHTRDFELGSHFENSLAN